MENSIVIPTTGEVVREGGTKSDRYGSDSQSSAEKGGHEC